MKDIMNLALVNYSTVWGDKEANLARILEYCDAAGKRGADFVVFPETALTGYGNDAGKERGEKMHCRLAETIPGPATGAVAEYAKKYHMYVVFGMAERDADNPEVVYNSAAIVYPDGRTDTYRKLHLPFDEAEWCVRGDRPVLIDTPWGPVGVAICYDTYCFPELVRYYRSMGARMCLNVTACPDAPCTAGSYKLALPAYAFVNYMYIATSNLCGPEHGSNFIGGSSVIGPDKSGGDVHVYLGTMYDEEGHDEPGMVMGTIDLGLVDQYAQIPVFRFNPMLGDRDWRGDLYAELFMESKKAFDEKQTGEKK